MRKLLLTACLAACQLYAQGGPASDAAQTRDELSRLFDRQPPQLREVLALDPGLLANEKYLAAYPQLSALLKTKPEIARNPAFYIGEPNRDRGPASGRIAEEVLAGSAVLLGIAMAAGLIVWTIRATLDHRRWNRVTRVQTEAHTKLLDRLSAHEELLEYIRSSAGSKFLEGAPLSTEGPRAIGAPHGRILWSVQAGLILVAGGIGIRLSEGHFPVDVAPVVNTAAMLSIALGVGFVISSVAAYAISRRLGLIQAHE